MEIYRIQFASFSAFLVPVAVSLLNAFQPPIIIKIAQFEQWDDPGRQVKYTVWRLFVAKLLNVILQVASFSMLADPVLLRGRSFGFILVGLALAFAAGAYATLPKPPEALK